MDMKLTPDETALRDDLRLWLGNRYDFAAALSRTRRGETRDEKLWRALVEDKWIARAMPRRDDPQQSAIDAALIAEEFGRAIVVEPFFRSAYLAAALALELLPANEGDALIGEIAQGACRAACALYEPDGRFHLDRIETRATEQAGGWRIDGRKAMVLDGADADRILVSARTALGAIGLFLVADAGEGTTRTRFRTIDDFAAADIEFAGTPARALAIGDEVPGGIEAAVDRTIVVLGAEALGAASAALDETAVYAGRREQFGRTLSSFQVVAHRLARMFVELEGLRGGLIEALSVATARAPDRAMASAGLKWLIGENGRFVVNQGIQLHGGVGTVDDYKVSHCFKRVFAIEVLFGNSDFHLDRYARTIA